MVQLYCGDGKGKTSAAVGAAVRAAGSGMRVLFVQFFKNGDSSELYILRGIEQIDLAFADVSYTLFEELVGEKRERLRASYQTLLQQTFEAADRYDMIVLDEGLSAFEQNMIDRAYLKDCLREHKNEREIILTGRPLPQALCDLADYVSRIRAVKHPYDAGVSARRGIEY